MMAAEPQGFDLTVRLTSETIIKASDHNIQPYILPLSNLDRLVSGFPVTIFYAYRRPSTGDLPSIFTAIKTSLAEALNHFFPFAGRILHNSKTGEAEILCNNNGVRLIEALANVSLAKLDFYNQNGTTKNVLLPTDHKFPLGVQITGYTCGGFSISWTFDHLLADASGFIKFLSSWCEIARTKKLSVVLNHDRLVFRPRSPPSYSQLIDKTYTVCTFDDIRNMLPNCATQKHLYLVKRSSLESLRAVSSKGGAKKTRTVALSAYLWKFMARTLDDSDDARCKMGWLVDGRRRMGGDSEAMLNFVGNVVSVAVREESVQVLKEGSLAHVAGVVSQAISEVANRAHFLDLIDWVECHRPGKVLANIVLGLGVPAIVMSSCHNMPVMSMDFGFGLPSVGMFCSALDRMGAGYVNLVSSGKGDGPWLVSAFLWPKLAAALESDPDYVFEPITADHLRL